ncbi:MAG: hypothetical protein Q9226_002570 [Calogaya cf. arnoldii]
MENWKRKRYANRGSGKSFHKFGYPADVDYMDEMLELCIQATRKEGLINSGLGKLPPNWGEKERWTRQRIHEIKTAVQDKGNARHDVKTLEDIGFDFDEWKRGQGNQNEIRQIPIQSTVCLLGGVDSDSVRWQS